MQDLQVVLATRNAGKLIELHSAFAGIPLRFRSLNEFSNISEVAEEGETYEENASLKAMGYSRQTGLMALADDSGLEVDALKGQPGVHSARYGGALLSDTERSRVLLAALQEVPATHRTARFICTLVLYGSLTQDAASTAKSGILAVSRGVCKGTIATELFGNEGFGFDPLFIPDGYDMTFGELPAARKNTISHRAKAAQAMRLELQRLFGPNLTASVTAS